MGTLRKFYHFFAFWRSWNGRTAHMTTPQPSTTAGVPLTEERITEILERIINKFWNALQKEHQNIDAIQKERFTNLIRFVQEIQNLPAHVPTKPKSHAIGFEPLAYASKKKKI